MQPWTIAVFLYNTKNEVQTETFPEVEKQKHGEEKVVCCMSYKGASCRAWLHTACMAWWSEYQDIRVSRFRTIEHALFVCEADM